MRILELCAGTGSIGNAFRGLGWEVVSLDLMPDFNPTIQADLMTWDYRVFPPGHFDVCWCSPPCVEYSIAKTTAPRKLDQADALVARMREIFDYLEPPIWAFENPATGLLKKRDVVAGLPKKVLTYCQYGFPYRKATAIWTNLDSWQPRRALLARKVRPASLSLRDGIPKLPRGVAVKEVASAYLQMRTLSIYINSTQCLLNSARSLLKLAFSFWPLEPGGQENVAPQPRHG